MTDAWLLFISALALAVLAVPAARAQHAPKHELRGAWISTVADLDWPDSKTASTAQQKEGLIEELDRLKAAGVNAVFFQVRTEADALYASNLEPWSYWLTATQGQAPEPFYDPLQFAIEEAHARGMELHAWFNPFRADRGSDYENAPTHVTHEHPDWLLQFDDGMSIFNPGLPAVRDYVTRVVMDVARRYDIDGVHFDDYFYPYPPHHMAQAGNRNKDRDAFEQHPRGFADIENWRRDNINRFVAQVHDSLRAGAPGVAFGISPFGIWKSGVPAGINGLSAYHAVYADAVAWLGTHTLDYLAPQLYWGFGGGQDYATLAPWWAEQADGRHIYPGLAAYKTDEVTFYDPSQYRPGAVPRQVRFNRRREDLQGSIFFRAANLTRFSSKGLADSLGQRLYRHPALTPTMPWKDTTPPGPPQHLTHERTEAAITLRWDPPAPAEERPEARRYAVYRVPPSDTPNFTEMMENAQNLLAVTGRATLTDSSAQAGVAYAYAVTAVSINSVESLPSTPTETNGRPPETPEKFSLRGNYPNPFSETTTIAVDLPEAAELTVEVYDARGRRVLQKRVERAAGNARKVDVDAAALSSGVYLYRVTLETDDAEENTESGRMVLVK